MENIVDDLIDELSHERYIIKVKYLVNEYKMGLDNSI